MKNNMSVDKILSISVYVSLIYVFAYLFKEIIFDAWFWYDEAGQFFISKGLNHYSQPFSIEQGLAEVIQNNRFYNLDPGGFSILLHFWCKISNHHLWLRLLPFSFFCLTLIVLYKYLVNSSKHNIVALGFVLFMMTAYPFVTQSSELRAYTMEMCGVALSMFLLQRYRENLFFTNLCQIAIVLSFFMTSRYGFIVYCFSFSLYLVYVKYKEKNILGIIQLIGYGLIMLTSVIIIYLLSMKWQNSEASLLTYMAKSYLSENLLSGLRSWLSIRAIILILLYIVYYKRRWSIPDILPISIGASFVYFILSLLGKYPWDDLHAMSLTTIQYLGIAYILCDTVRVKKQELSIKLFIIICALFVFVSAPNLSKRDTHVMTEKLMTDVNNIINNIDKNDSIYVCPWHNAELRYQFEYGTFKTKYTQVYLNQMSLDRDKSHNTEGENVGYKKSDYHNTQYKYYILSWQDNKDGYFRLSNSDFIYESFPYKIK